MNSFEDLEVWKAARELRKDISKMAKRFPIEEKFRLKDQIIKSSRSAPANIAEGFGRFHFRENIQFCRQARGSINETLEHVICAFDEGYIAEHMLEGKRKQINQCLKLLNGYISYLKKVAIKNKGSKADPQ